MSTSLVIMAAGLGSRYGGIKQMAGVGPNDEILLEYAVYDALQAGFDEIVVILRPDIENDFRERVGRRLEKHVPLRYVLQDFSSLPSFYAVPAGRTKPFGTIHAVLCARDVVDGPFAVLNADDYYGPDAFFKMRTALDALRSKDEACMVAYRLENTVSPYGSVTRGVCAVSGDSLSSIRETHEISILPQGDIISPESPDPHGLLDGSSPVSMNFWGFTPAAFDDMEAYFNAFLSALPPLAMQGECLLPVYVGDRIGENALCVRVLQTDACWFGMTYQADWAITAENLRRLHAQNVYPPVLFA